MVHTSKPILPLNSRFLTKWLIRQTTQCPLSKIFQFVHWFRLVHHCVLTNWPMTVQPFFKWKSPNFDHMQYKRKKDGHSYKTSVWFIDGVMSWHYQTFLSSKGNFNHENVLHTGIHFWQWMQNQMQFWKQMDICVLCSTYTPHCVRFLARSKFLLYCCIISFF